MLCRAHRVPEAIEATLAARDRADVIYTQWCGRVVPAFTSSNILTPKSIRRIAKDPDKASLSGCTEVESQY